MKTCMLAAAALLLGGCDDDKKTPAAVEGVAVDGYLRGALACLDMNGNFACDAGEPAAQTGAGGRFSIPLGSLSADDAASMSIVVEVPPTAVDEDTGAPVEGFYSLAAPAGRHAVISPLTMLVVAQMQAHGQTEAEAAAALAADLGVADPELLFADFARTDASPAERALSEIGQAAATLLAKGYAGFRFVSSEEQSPGQRAATFIALSKELTTLVPELRMQAAAGTLEWDMVENARRILTPVINRLLADRFVPATELAADLESGLCSNFSTRLPLEFSIYMDYGVDAECNYLEQGHISRVFRWRGRMGSMGWSPNAVPRATWADGRWVESDLNNPAASVAGNVVTLTWPGKTETWTATVQDLGDLDISANSLFDGHDVSYLGGQGQTFPQGSRLYRFEREVIESERLREVQGEMPAGGIASVDDLLAYAAAGNHWIRYGESYYPTDIYCNYCGHDVYYAQFVPDGRLWRYVTVSMGYWSSASTTLPVGSWRRESLLGLDVVRLLNQNQHTLAIFAVDDLGQVRSLARLPARTSSNVIYMYRFPEGHTLDSVLGEY